METLNILKNEQENKQKNKQISNANGPILNNEQTLQKNKDMGSNNTESEKKTSLEKYTQIIDKLLSERDSMFDQSEKTEDKEKNGETKEEKDTEAISKHQEKIDMVRRYAISVASSFLEKWAKKLENQKDNEPIKPINIKIKGAEDLANATAIAAMTLRGWMLEKYGKSNPSLCMKLINAVHFRLTASDPVVEEGGANKEIDFEQETIKNAKISKIDKSLKNNKDLPIASLGANVSTTTFYTLKANDKNVSSASFLHTNKVFICEKPVPVDLMSKIEEKCADGIYYVDSNYEIKSFADNPQEWNELVKGKVDEFEKVDKEKADAIRRVVNTFDRNKAETEKGNNKNANESNTNNLKTTELNIDLEDTREEDEESSKEKNKDEKIPVINDLINGEKLNTNNIQIQGNQDKNKDKNKDKDKQKEKNKIVDNKNKSLIDEYTVTEANCEALLNKYKDYEYKGLIVKEKPEEGEGEPKEILISADPELIQKYINKNKEKWIKENKQDLLYHYVFRVAALTKLNKTIKAVSSKKISTPKATYFDQKGKTTEAKKHKGMRLDCVQKRAQTTTNGCWSQSMSTLLGAFGIDVSQEEIRSYRPDITVNDQNSDYLSYNLNNDVLYSVAEQSKLISQLMPQIVVHNIEIEKGAKEHIKTTSKNIIEKNKAYADGLKDQFLYALETCHSPVSIVYNRHFRTVYGYEMQGKNMVLLCKNSAYKDNPNDEERIGLDELLTKETLSLTFLQKDTEFDNNYENRLKMVGRLSKEEGMNSYHKDQKHYSDTAYYPEHCVQYAVYSNSIHKVEESLDSDRKRINAYPIEMTEFIIGIFKERIDGLDEDKGKLESIAKNLSALLTQLKGKKKKGIKRIINQLKTETKDYCEGKGDRSSEDDKDKEFINQRKAQAEKDYAGLEGEALKQALDQAEDTARRMVSAYNYMVGDGLINLLIEVLDNKYSS